MPSKKARQNRLLMRRRGIAERVVFRELRRGALIELGTPCPDTEALREAMIDLGRRAAAAEQHPTRAAVVAYVVSRLEAARA